MDVIVSHSLIRKTPAERGRILGNVRKYVHNDSFLNVVANMDINNTAQISRTCSQLSAFNSLKDLWDEVELWLGC